MGKDIEYFEDFIGARLERVYLREGNSTGLHHICLCFSNGLSLNFEFDFKTCNLGTWQLIGSDEEKNNMKLPESCDG